MTKAEQPTITQSLKPCPFCGKIPELRWHSSPECWVECECGAVGPNDADTTTDENMAAWNTRASLAAQDGLVEALETMRNAIATGDTDWAVELINKTLSAIKGDKS